MSIVLGGQSVCREPTGAQEGGEGQPRQDNVQGFILGSQSLVQLEARS